MKTQVTKRKLTLKTKKAGSYDGADAPEGAADGDAPEAAQAPVAMAAPAGPAVVDASYHKPAAIIAIIAALVVLGLIVVQALEWYYYQQSPSVWPPKIPGAASR